MKVIYPSLGTCRWSNDVPCSPVSPYHAYPGNANERRCHGNVWRMALSRRLRSGPRPCHFLFPDSLATQSLTLISTICSATTGQIAHRALQFPPAAIKDNWFNRNRECRHVGLICEAGQEKQLLPCNWQMSAPSTLAHPLKTLNDPRVCSELTGEWIAPTDSVIYLRALSA